MAKLPQDVLKHVLDLAIQDYSINRERERDRDLLSYMRISRAWRPLAERYLYADIIIFDTDEARSFIRTLGCKPDLGDHVRELYLNFKDEQDILGRKITELCPKLRKLRCPDYNLLQLKDILPKLSLTHLEIDETDEREDVDVQPCFSNGEEFMSIIRCWPKIEAIGYFECGLNADLRPLFPANGRSFTPAVPSLKEISHRPFPLRALELYDFCLPVDGYRALLSLPLPHLEEFTACIGHSDGSDDVLLDCLNAWAPHLKEVTVWYSHRHMVHLPVREGWENFFFEAVQRMVGLEVFRTQPSVMQLEDIFLRLSPSLRRLTIYDSNEDELTCMLEWLRKGKNSDSRALPGLECLVLDGHRRNTDELLDKLRETCAVRNIELDCVD